jgi:hypothetical protein
MTTLWPKQQPRHTESEAEKKVYKALKSGLPKGWQAWHSLRLRSKKTGRFSETDFVIADPSNPSILILEVKGGRIETSDGRWYQNGHPMKSSPLDQALTFRTLLVERFRHHKIEAPKMGCAVCFPNTMFEKGPLGDDLRGLVIGEKDLPYLNGVLPEVMTNAVPKPWPVSNRWVQALHKLWGETWVPEICLGSRVQLDEEKRLQLDHAQMNIIESLSANDRLCIQGPAGSGKTLLAIEAALRETQQSKRVLFLCYTEALAAFLKECLKKTAIRVGAIRNFASNLLGESAPEKLMGQSSTYWEGVSLRAAIDGLPNEDERWETVIVDEAQDFSGDDWELAKECVHPDGKFWVFGDQGQAFWPDRGLTEEMIRGFPKFNLMKPYRCHPAIQHLDECYSGQCELDKQLLKKGLKEGTIRIITSSEGRLLKQIEKEISRLLSGGLKRGDIAVLSLRGRGSKESITHRSDIGGHPIVLATDPAAGENIICDTFLRFKGLERPAVIITDLRLVSNLYEKRMHIAVSRALSLLRIVGVESEILKDDRISRLV